MKKYKIINNETVVQQYEKIVLAKNKKEAEKIADEKGKWKLIDTIFIEVDSTEIKLLKN